MKLEAVLDTELGGIFESFRATSPILRPAWEDFATQMLLAARDDWPTDTWTSYDAWDSSVYLDGEATIVAELVNRARDQDNNRGYAAYVYRAGTSPSDKVWEEKYTNIVDNLGPQLMDSCIEIIDNTVEG